MEDSTPPAEPDWDAFISYASEDRESLVSPLVKLLTDMGLQLWWDQFELSVGDSLLSKINRGLAESRFGIVVISPDFLDKRWPDYELRGLTAREMTGSKVVLPVWFNVTFDQLIAVNPVLAEKKSAQIAGGYKHNELVRVALDLLGVINPALLTRLHRRVAYESARRRSVHAEVDPRELKVSPPVHDALPTELITRIRLVRAALMWGYPHTMDFWVTGFRRDSHPSNEVAIWERIACAFLEFCQYIDEITPEIGESAFSFLLSLSLGSDAETTDIDANIADHRILLANLYYSEKPLIEVKVNESLPRLEEVEGDPRPHVEDFDDRMTDEQVSMIADSLEQEEGEVRRRD